jgi:hypothetical protein
VQSGPEHLASAPKVVHVRHSFDDAEAHLLCTVYHAGSVHGSGQTWSPTPMKTETSITAASSATTPGASMAAAAGGIVALQ